MKTDNRSNPIDIAVTLHKNSKVDNCEIGVVKNYYQEPTFEANYAQAIDSLLEDFSTIEDSDIRVKLQRIIYQVDNYYKQNLHPLKTLMEQISCSFSKLPKVRQIRSFLIFSFTVVLYNSYKITDYQFQAFNIEGINQWLFSPHPYNAISLEKSIAKIYNYLMISDNKMLKNGVCYISDLVSDDRVNCSNCTNGVLHFESKVNILKDFMESQKPQSPSIEQIQKDFFQIQSTRNLVFKCGNCITNIDQIQKGLRILNTGGSL